MKVTFFSNFLNHHQLPLCESFISKKGVEFTFVATEEIPQERLDLGYENMNEKYNFVFPVYKSKKNYEKAIKLGYESDIVIIGGADNIYIEERLKDLNKITFRYSERLFKNRDFYWLLAPLKNLRFLKNYYRNHKYHLLCASAYSAKDFNKLGLFKNKCYRWGYFPKVNKYNLKKLFFDKKNDVIEIIWVGRFLKLKHPEYIIDLANYLNKRKYKYHINMIGIGPLYNKIKAKVAKYDLSSNISLLGSMPNEDVISYMKKANVFLFTSDIREGWGAVLNEAMNSACAVVANKNIGSVPYLLQNGHNGLVYNNKKDFLTDIESLLNNRAKIEELGKNAYETVFTKWNAETAVNNLFDLYDKIVKNNNIININYDNGPCSYDKGRGC